MIQYKAEYSLLVVLASIYLVGVFHYQGSPRIIMFLTIGYSIAYVIWGVIHHLISKNLHFRIVLEYLLIGLLGVIIISTLLV